MSQRCMICRVTVLIVEPKTGACFVYDSCSACFWARGKLFPKGIGVNIQWPVMMAALPSSAAGGDPERQVNMSILDDSIRRHPPLTCKEPANVWIRQDWVASLPRDGWPLLKVTLTQSPSHKQRRTQGGRSNPSILPSFAHFGKNKFSKRAFLGSDWCQSLPQPHPWLNQI